MSLSALFFHFLLFSLLSIGGAINVAPEMHRLLVEQTGLLTDTQFHASIAMAQAAPGPNILFVAVLGYQAAGLPGVAALMTGIMLPSTLLAWMAAHWGQRYQQRLAVRAFKTGMAPLVIGLLFATGALLSTPALAPTGLGFGLLVLACALVVWRTRLPVLWLIALGALLGAMGWV